MAQSQGYTFQHLHRAVHTAGAQTNLGGSTWGDQQCSGESPTEEVMSGGPQRSVMGRTTEYLRPVQKDPRAPDSERRGRACKAHTGSLIPG